MTRERWGDPNDAALTSWVPLDAAGDFPVQNLPLGVFEGTGGARIGAAIGDRIVDLRAASEAGLLDGIADPAALRAATLNALFAAGRPALTRLRARLSALLRSDGDPALHALADALLVDRSQARMQVPLAIGDYVDFYSSLEHATNLGRIFRPDGEPLLPNWRWIPIGYHGRAGSVAIDGTPVRRPCGQRKAPDAAAPTFGPSAMLDIELEMGFFAAGGNRLGEPIAAAAAEAQIGGFVLVNDWSARDVQAWEYQPLGPFLGKSFLTTISPWVVSLDALEPFRVAGPLQEPPPLGYLQAPGPHGFSIELAVTLQSAAMRAAGVAPATIARGNFAGMYWSAAQQLAHASSNGARVRPGDLFASGTISGSTPDSYGSLIELTWRGTRPLVLPSGEQRRFLEDGDDVALHAWCEKPGAARIGFGLARGRVEPAGAA